MKHDEIRLECLKLVMPQGGNPDPAHYIPKAQALFDWVTAGGDNGAAAPATQPDPVAKKSGITLARASAARQ
jgi:hypothetical protein